MSLSAIHLRCGDPAEAGMVEDWMARHAVRETRCDDPLDATVLMLTRPDLVPDLVFVGLHRLAPADRMILNWLRETWPHVAIVAYGPGERPSPAGARHCVDRAALERVLALKPAGLIDLLARERGEDPGRQQFGACGNGESPHDAAAPVYMDARAILPPESWAACVERDVVPMTQSLEANVAPAAASSESRAAEAAREFTPTPAAAADETHSKGLRSIALEKPMLTAAELADLLDGPAS